MSSPGVWYIPLYTVVAAYADGETDGPQVDGCIIITALVRTYSVQCIVLLPEVCCGSGDFVLSAGAESVPLLYYYL